MDEPEPDSLEALLERQERPMMVGVAAYPERMVLTLPTAAGLHRFVIPMFGVVGAILGALLVVVNFRWGPPEPLFSLLFLLAAVSPIIAAAVGALLHVVWGTVRMRMVRQVELTSHRVVLQSALGDELWRGSVHDLSDIWIAHDMTSSVIGIRADSIKGFRIHGHEEAVWLARVLRSWRSRHARVGVDPDFERVAALGARASQGT